MNKVSEYTKLYALKNEHISLLKDEIVVKDEHIAYLTKVGKELFRLLKETRV